MLCAALPVSALGEQFRLTAEIERLQDAKRRALAIADERSKENVDLRAENERLLAHYNLLRDALSWYSAHANWIGHVPQWVTMARALEQKASER